MRLTEKDGTLKLESIADNKWNKAITKLGQLEDIEEELGIDLITLFKALKNGFWYKKENTIVYVSKNDYLLSSGAIHYVGKGLIFAGLFLYNKDYGKTWSLEKEELE